MTESPLKIGLLGPAPPFRGGISQFALMLAREYQRNGHEVRMFTFQRQYPKLLFPGGDQTTEFSQGPDILIEKVFTPYQPGTWKTALEKINEFAPDVLVLSYFLPWFAPSYAWISKRLTNVKVICLAHNISFHEKWPGADLLTRRLFQNCDRIVLLSRACMEDLRKKMPGSIAEKAVQGFHPIYDFYPKGGDAKRTRDKEQPTLLFFGLIKPYKGVDVLLDVLKQAIQRIPDLKLIIAGAVYGDQKRYTSQIRRLGLDSHVETHFQYVTDAEVASFFTRSQVCVLPYKTATQSGVIATSYSFDVPVIASDVGGLGEYISDGITGFLVPPDDPEALSGAIIRFFEGGYFAKMSRNIPTYKAQFSWEKLVEITLEG